jgi:ketosteroid isomerase-like protein
MGRSPRIAQWPPAASSAPCSRETWDASEAEPITDFIDASDRVVAEFIWRGTGHGPDFAFEGAAVYTMRNGMIFAIEYFGNLAEALEAVGLSEQDAHADS